MSLVVVMLMVAACAEGRASGPTAPASASTQPPVAVPAQVAASVQYLRDEYGVSDAEALRRLELQRDAPRIERLLASRFPAEYAGMWLDQDHGGVLVVLATRPELLRAWVARLPQAGFIRVVPATYPLRDLRALAARVQRHLSVGNATADVDEPGNQVAVWVARDGLARTRQEVAALRLDPKVVTVWARVEMTPD